MRGTVSVVTATARFVVAVLKAVMPCEGRRKIERVSCGAAMKITMSAWITVTMSTGMATVACISVPPCLRMPNSRPA
jgi:hypothetical protein